MLCYALINLQSGIEVSSNNGEVLQQPNQSLSANKSGVTGKKTQTTMLLQGKAIVKETFFLTLN